MSKQVPGLQVSGLDLRRGERLLVSSLSFQVSPGEALYITGPNGSGKTTLLKTIAGIYPYESGLVSCTPTFYLGHENGLYERLTVKEQVAYFAHCYAAKQDGRLLELLELLSLSTMADQIIAKLSCGQKRRLALARLWLSSASVWLLDEPEAGLDHLGLDCLKQRVLEVLVKKQVSLLYTSHQGPLLLSKKLDLSESLCGAMN